MVTVRTRSFLWSALGVAFSVLIVWTFAAWRADAAPGPNESTFVPVAPVRILDSRDPTNIGLAGPFVSAVSQDLRVTGTIPTATGTQIVVPPLATGVALNVTVVSPAANGFVSIRPADAVGAPTTSSLNFLAGQIAPNAVEVQLPVAGPDAGEIEITYDAYGIPGPTTDILIDVVGYNTNKGLQELVADVATKANAADVYTKAQTDAALATKANAGNVYTKAEIDASVANFMKAAGQVNTDGTTSSGTAGFGIFTTARSGTGSYSITLPGLNPGCASDFPLVMLSPFFSGHAVYSFGVISCGSGDTSVFVSTTNTADAAADGAFHFVIYTTPNTGLPPVPTEAKPDGVVCTIEQGGPAVCE